MNAVRALLSAAALTFWTAGVSAGTASANFDVHITLNTEAAPGVCITGSATDALGTSVKVVCDTRQFISIKPAKVNPFTLVGANLGQGPAGNFVLEPGTSDSDGYGLIRNGARISSWRETYIPVELVFEDPITGNRIRDPETQAGPIILVPTSETLYASVGTQITQRLTALDITTPTVMLIIF